MSHERVTRRAVLRVGVGSAALALLAACQPATPAQPSASAPTVSTGPTPAAVSSTQVGGGQPRSGGTLRMGIPGGIITLDGHNYAGTPHVFHVWDRLVVQDEQLNIQPRLAESWQINPDYTRIQLNLRKGVQFHTGREMTSDDVAWNLNRVRDPSVGGGIFANFVSILASVDTPDKYTVVLNATQPYPWVAVLLQTLNILDPVTMQSPDGVNKPVGTGPFTFVDYAQGDHLTLKKNPNYWRTGLPHLDQLHFGIFSDPQAMVAQLEGGALDAANQPPLRDAVRLRSDPHYQAVFNQAGGGSYVFPFNTSVAPANSKLLRQALWYGLDRQRIVDSTLLGVGRVSDLPWYPSSPGYEEAKTRTYTFDLDRAKALLSQAGATNLSVDLSFTTALPEFASMAQIFQADLAKIGVTLNIKPTEPAQIAQRVYTLNYSGLAALGLSLFGQLHPGLFGLASPYYGPLNNWTGFKDEQYSALATAIATEVDPTRAKQAFANWNDYVLDQAFLISVATSPQRFVTTTAVQGLAYDMANILDATEAWIV